jgi:type I protein arginine methyltransferase
MTTEEVTFISRSDLTIRTLPSHHVEISFENEIQQMPAIALSILDVFTSARTVEDAHDLLAPRIADEDERVCLYDTVSQMLSSGILVPVTRDEADSIPKVSRGYGAPRIHVSMLRDAPRTTAYLNAIRECVGPDDVVLDIGTGTGVLAVAAAEAGARQVYAIEANPETARFARALINGSEARERIKLIEGWSTKIHLPERCDVLVSEMIGDDPLDENILAMTDDAIARHLKPNPRLIPNRLDIIAQPLRMPRKLRQEEFFCEDIVAGWEKLYGLNFRPLLDSNPRQAMEQILPQDMKKWELIGEPRVLTSIDLTRISKAVFDEQFDFDLGDQVADGMAVYFETRLSEGQLLSTTPSEVGDTNHWLSPCHMFRSEFRNRLTIGFRYGVSDALDGVYLPDAGS